MKINWTSNTLSVDRSGWVVVGMLLLSYGFGFMSQATAEKLASTTSERAVIAVLAPACADMSVHYRMLPHEQRPS